METANSNIELQLFDADILDTVLSIDNVYFGIMIYST